MIREEKMDILILIMFFIMFIVIISVILYLIYDYIDYKQDVDKSMIDTTAKINTNIGIANSNINITKKVLDNSISSVKNDVNTIKNYNDNIVTRMNVIDTNFNNISDNLSSYFKFTDDRSNTDANNKLYNRTFSTINPDLNLLTNVTAVSGMTIKTNPKLNKNLKICNDTSNNCMKINVDDRSDNNIRYYDKNNNEYYPSTIKLSPDNVSFLRLNNKDDKALVEFDLVNNSICLGGGLNDDNINNNCPLKIEDGKIYLNDLSIVATSNNIIYNVSGNKINELTTTVRNTLTNPSFNNYIDTIANKIITLDNNINTAIVNYTMTYDDVTKTKSIDFNIKPNVEINFMDQYLLITLPTYIIGKLNLSNYDIIYNTNTPIQFMNCIDKSKTILANDGNNITIGIFFNRNILIDFILDFKLNSTLSTQDTNDISSSKSLTTYAYITPISINTNNVSLGAVSLGAVSSGTLL